MHMSKEPEVKPSEELESNMVNEMLNSSSKGSEQANKVEIEQVPLVDTEKIKQDRLNEKEQVIKDILFNVIGELYNYLTGKTIGELRRLQNGEPIDVLIAYVGDTTSRMAERARRLQTALSSIARLTGATGTGALRGREAIEQMLYERFLQSMAGSIGSAVEAQGEAQRRRRISEEILRELSNKGSGQGNEQ